MCLGCGSYSGALDLWFCLFSYSHIRLPRYAAQERDNCFSDRENNSPTTQWLSEDSRSFLSFYQRYLSKPSYHLSTDALVTWTREGKGDKKEGKEGKSSDGWLSLSIIWTVCGKVEWSKNMPVHSFIQQTYEEFQAVLPVVQTLQCEQRKDTLLWSHDSCLIHCLTYNQISLIDHLKW